MIIMFGGYTTFNTFG